MLGLWFESLIVECELKDSNLSSAIEFHDLLDIDIEDDHQE